jgi:transcription elongation factor GreA
VARIAVTVRWARESRLPVFHIVHESRRPGAATFVPGSPALAIHDAVTPRAEEPIITKHLPGAFTDTALEAELRRRGIERVIVSGFMTQMCCDTTTREAAHRGFKVTLLSDATAAMDVKGPDGLVIPHDQVHRTHLGSLNGFLAEVKRSDEVERLKKERPSIVRAIAEARAHGDLSENAEYHAARERQGFIEARITDLESKVGTAEVIDPPTSGDRVTFGSTVKLEDEDGKEAIYQIVGSDEADPKRGMISIMSPLARTLISKKVGDSVVATLPGGKKTFEILAANFPIKP